MQRWSFLRKAAFALLLTVACGGVAKSQSLGFRLIATGLVSPVAMTHAGDGSNRLFLVEQGGTIRVHNGSALLPQPFLNITAKVLSGGERGLLGLAFDPAYATNGFFYVYYTSQPAGQVTVARYSVTADQNVANPNSEVILKTQAHASFSNHNGGQLAFGPDGCLYAGIGDGGSGGDPDNNGQNIATLLGKVIRINPSDGAPCSALPGNPFVGTSGAREEIWALGLRNPWKFSFDRQTGDLLIADVGQGQREEVNSQPPGAAGRNYCWRRKEGTLIFDASVPCTIGTPTDPVLEYDHSAGDCAIIGGFRYRGSMFPALSGTYFYGDLCTGRVWGATESVGVWTTAELRRTTFVISSFGEDEAGEIYLIDLAGAVYQLVDLPRTATHDLNGDGWSDLAWRQSGGQTAIWLMNGAKISQSGPLGVVAANWQIVGQRDFNGDGRHDWLWRDSNTGMTAIWLLNGFQVSQSGNLGAVQNNWQIVGTADFNGDGKGDILWNDATTGTVAIWLLNGLQISQTGNLGAVASNWIIAGTGDVNGDGKADIVWRDSVSGTVAIWLLNGLQISQAVSLGVVSNNWTIVGTGDFNADGKTDLLWRDGTSGAVAIWFLNGAQIVQSNSLGVVGPEWSIVETGDFNGDTMSDLLWRKNDGAVAMWLLNGAQILLASQIATVGTDWTVQSNNVD